MTNTPALKPCPFCGGEAKLNEILQVTLRNIYYINCTACFSEGPTDYDRQYVINVWNRRASQWISVEERLPQPNKPDDVCVAALVLSNGDEPEYAYYRIGYLEFVGMGWYDDDRRLIDNVTHWQPLPEMQPGREECK